MKASVYVKAYEGFMKIKIHDSFTLFLLQFEA